jgi:LmbE family N-acetylglucosaminyl deacetylase
MKLLAIGAHPDDIELGCGGLLIKAAREGHDVFLYTLTKGSASGDPEQRTREVLRSSKFIGARGAWVDDFPDSNLAINSGLINAIEHKIDQVDPDLIITHFKGDAHHDHRAVAAATLEAARFESNVLAFEIPLTRDFEPKVYYDISDVIDDKVELIKIFWSQKTKLYTKANAIKGLAEFRALQSRLNTSVDFVEAFDVAKLCLGPKFQLRKVQYTKPELPRELVVD